MDAKERHAKKRSRLKEHFAKKREKASMGPPKADHKATTHSAPKPQPKAKSIPSTQGKTLTYGKGRSTVIDLGHNPSQQKINAGVAKLKSTPKVKNTTAQVKLSTAPKPKQNTASTAPTVQRNASTGTGTTDKVIAGLGIAAAAGATVGAIKALKKSRSIKKPTAAQAEVAASKKSIGRKGRAPVRKGLPKPLLGLPAPPKGLPAPPKGLPAPKAIKASVLKDLHDRSKPSAARVSANKVAGAKAALSARSDARRAKQGAGLKGAFEAAERADSKAGKGKVKPIKIGTTKISPESIVEQKPKQIIRSSMDKAGVRTMEVLRGKGLAAVTAEAEKRVADRRQGRRRGTAGATRPGMDQADTQGRKPAPKRSSRRKAGSDPRGGKPTDAPKVPKGPKHPPVTSQVAVKPTPKLDIPGRKGTTRIGPKPAAPTGVVKLKVPTEGLRPERRTVDTNIPDPKGQRKTDGPIKKSGPTKQITPKVQKNAATEGMSGDARKAANQAAREAIRAGDPVAAKKAIAGLPETGRKQARYRVKLDKLAAGAVQGGSKPKAAPKAEGGKVKLAAPKANEAPTSKGTVKLDGAGRQAANQAARAAVRAGDPVAAKKALAGLPDSGKKQAKYRVKLEGIMQGTETTTDPKLQAKLEVERAKNIKLKASLPADQAQVETEKSTAKKKLSSYKQRKKNFRDRKNKIDPKTGKPTNLNLMETTIEKQVTPEQTAQRDAAEARERAKKLGAEAKSELELRKIREDAAKKPTSERGGKGPKPTQQAAANRGATEAVAKAAVKSPEVKRVTANEQAHEQHQRRVAEGRQTENVNVRELAKQVQDKAKLGQADNMRQKMARGAADAVLREAGKQTSAAPGGKVKLTGAAPKVTKTEAQAQYKKLKAEGSGVKSSTAGAVKKVHKVTKTSTTPVKGGEQLPRSQPKTNTYPSRADLLAEQRGAKGKPQTTPPKARKPMNVPVKRDLASNIKRYLDRFSKPAAPLKSPSIGANVGENIKKPATGAVARTIKGGVKAGAVLTGLFALADAGVSAASEHDPSKRVGKAKEALKESVKHGGKEVAKWTAAGIGASLLPGIAGTAATIGLTTVAPAYFTYKAAKEFTIPKLKELGAQVEGTMTSKREAKEEKKASQAKYGSVEAATKTRHAKEAYKKKQKDLLTGGK